MSLSPEERISIGCPQDTTLCTFKSKNTIEVEVQGDCFGCSFTTCEDDIVQDFHVFLFFGGGSYSDSPVRGDLVNHVILDGDVDETSPFRRILRICCDSFP